jgi:hypothetical protein
MVEQVRRLEAIFKRRVGNINDDDGDDNSFGEYWEFIEPDKVESWSIKLNPMTASIYFIHKFKNPIVFLSILYDELVKEVLFENCGIILILCETRANEPYIFILCVEYCKSPFHLPILQRG